jgi:WD40 repeat protein
MTDARDDATATLLTDGRVLIAGPAFSSAFPRATLASAELYDPKTGIFSPTDPTAEVPGGHTATLLSDGRVLIAGGDGDLTANSGGPLASAELWDPKTGKFAPTGSMITSRDGHTATLLSDGRVLIAGGFGLVSSGTYGVLASAELYDPKTGTFTVTGSMTTARQYHTATRLSDGRVLITGGFDVSGASLASAELYDPRTGTFTVTGSMTHARLFDTATLLSDSRVLMAGGWTGTEANSGLQTTIASAELYDPKTGTFSPTGSMTTDRSGHTATALPDGRVLVAGGEDDSGASLASAELFDPRTGTFDTAGSMSTSRDGHTATLLSDGRVLIAGGIVRPPWEPIDVRTVLASAEVYQPPPRLR